MRPILVPVRLSPLQDSSSTSSSPAPERSDEPAPGNLRDSPKNSQQKRKKRENNRDLDDRLRDLPEWSEEFTENLEDTKGEKVEGTYCGTEKTRETARVRSQGSLKETAQGGDLSALETNRQGEDPRTFKVPVERWRVQKKWKGKKKKKDREKNVKYSGSSLWKKASERIASFLAAKWKEEEEEK